DGSGGMVNRPALPTGFAPSQFALADVGGDNIPDLLIANAGNNLVQLFFGTGDGQFTGGVILTTGKGPQDVLAADIDNDKDFDPIVANGTDATLSLFRNAPASIPASPTETFPTAGKHPTVLLTGLVNADVYPDIVVLTQGESLCVGGPRKTLPCSIDAECQSPVDTSGTCTGGSDGGVQVFAGGPAGPPPGLVAGPLLSLGTDSAGRSRRPRAGALRDLDGDQKLDLVIADFTGGAVLVLQGNGDGTFAPPVATTLGGGPADLAFLPSSSDLVVVDATDDRVELLQWTGTTYVRAPTSPASPWRDTTSMALIGADSIVGFDAVLLQTQGDQQRTKARLDVVSGIGDGSFRATPVFNPKGAAHGSMFVVSDLRQDGRPDLAILDATAGTVTILTQEVSGQFQERDTLATAAGVTDLLVATPLSESVADYDRDGVPNVVDDCPTVYNPPMCRVTDTRCLVKIPCTNTTLTPTACDFATDLDPVTQQCDTDHNGIGDHCQILGSTTDTPDVCFALDSDFDLKADYDQNVLKRTTAGDLDFDGDGVANAVDLCPTVADALQTDTDGNGVGDACQVVGPLGQSLDTDKDDIPDYDINTHVLDNCPLIYNHGQEDNDNDKVGNACVVARALDNCVSTLNPNQEDRDGDGVGNACSAPAQDLFLLDSAPNGRIDVLLGDNSGTFRTDDAPTLPSVSGPTAVTSGHFTLDCIQGLPAQCTQRPVFDLAVTEAGNPNASGDDFVAVFAPDAMSGAYTSLPPFPLSADPTQLLRATDQQVCPLSGSPTTPLLRFDPDNRSDYLLALTPGSSTLNVLLPSNQNELNASLPPLVRPVAQGTPLPVPAGPVEIVLADVNQDLKQDIVVLSSSGGLTTIKPYLGLGNGLFFTDPSLDTTGLPFTSTHLASANIDLRSDSIYPDLLLFETRDEAPFSLLNVLPERADIDGSGRVDGYDLTLLARAFASTRGEDFTLQPDGTFARTGNGVTDVILRTGAKVPGQDLPDGGAACNATFEPGTGAYGVPVDINLDGIIDGLDLAFLASRFGAAIP
ncbi:MAG TPA: FG-GAP-like repeat-containing protein, partial [Candidatus Polarisedimenticolia bacterium]|nr:FG-GAP-like repeat-containing protein [Candidatus Polarisedimenticolia bacterium]